MAEYLEERKLIFSNMDGEKEEYSLEENEFLLNIKCPMDKTFLIISTNSNYARCPKCRSEYDRYRLSEEHLQTQLNYYLESSEKRLREIEKEKSSLIKFLNFARSQTLPKCNVEKSC